MSLRGEKYDGDLFGGSANFTERRDSFDNESKTNRNAAPKRTARQISIVNSEENAFEESGDKDRYLITYADLITLLLGLFIILYAMSNIDKEKYQNFASALGTYFGHQSVIIPTKPQAEFVTGPKENLSSQLSKLIVENNYSSSIQLEESERGITVHIMENLLFAPGRADLSELAKIVLESLAGVIKTLPNDIRVEGHTDDTPINTSRYPSNWHLSVDRALNTAYYLIKEEGLDPDKVSIVGYAEYKPVSANENQETRSKNRRVDLVILK